MKCTQNVWMKLKISIINKNKRFVVVVVNVADVVVIILIFNYTSLNLRETFSDFANNSRNWIPSKVPSLHLRY